MDEQEISISALLAEFGTRLNELEEKQRLLKDRLLLIGENLVSTKEDYDKRDLEFRKKVNEMDFEVKVLKQLTKRIINELENFTRKEEFAILEKQFKMFEPLEFARIQDIKAIVQKEMSEIIKNKNIKNKDN
jgi:hypothetical protein